MATSILGGLSQETTQEQVKQGVDELNVKVVKADTDNVTLNAATIAALVESNDAIVYLLSAMLEKMPRVTAADQCAVSIESGNLTAITTVSNVTSLTGRYVTHAPEGFSAMDASRIYNNIHVS